MLASSTRPIDRKATEPMYARSTQEWWLWTIRGVVAAFFGVVALVFPAPSLGLALLLLGAYLQLDGLAITIAVCWGWRASHALPLAITGLLGFTAGLTALTWPGFASSFLVPAVGTYCFLRGGLELIHALHIRAHTRQAWNLIVASLFAVGFGALLLSQPDLEPSTLAWSFVAFVTVTGACLIATAFGNQPAVDTVLNADQSSTAGKADMSNQNHLFTILVPLVSFALLGCASGGGATGAAPVQVTDRGATSLVNASLDRASGWTRDAFAALNIRMKEVEQKQDERTFKGAAGDMDVTAELDRTATGTRIEITVRRRAATWDREFAQRVLARIVRRA